MSDVPFLDLVYTARDESSGFESYHPGTDIAAALTSGASGSGGGAMGNDGSSIWRRSGNSTTTQEYVISTDTWGSSTAGTQRQYVAHGSFDNALVEGYGEDGSSVNQDDFYEFIYSTEVWSALAVDTGNDNDLVGSFPYSRRLHSVGGFLSPYTLHRIYDYLPNTHAYGTLTVWK